MAPAKSRDGAAAREAEVGRQHASEMSVAVIGAHTGLREVMHQVEQVAHTDVPVLIFGATGSGKEVVARAIHERSVRASGPVLRVNCGAISPELVDSELFGHERGSFTGAIAQRSGWFERADGGTLFLDEIAELPPAAQVRLLRVLQDGVFERVGGVRPLKVDVRVVGATHRDLAAMTARGEFRADLWYRLNVFTIRLPSLRERHADIEPLASHFAALASHRLGGRAIPIEPEDLALLRAYEWPGNVRELAAVMERAVILGEGRRLEVARALGASMSDARTATSDPRTATSDERTATSEPRSRTSDARTSMSEFPTLDQAMRAHIERALEQCSGRIEGPRGAAKLLALNANTLRSKMQKLGIAFGDRRGD